MRDDEFDREWRSTKRFMWATLALTAFAMIAIFGCVIFVAWLVLR